MLNQNNVLILLYSIPVYQMLYFTIQLVTFSRRNAPKRYLGLLMLLMTAFLIIHALSHLSYNGILRIPYLLYIPLLLSLAPMHYLFIVGISRGRQYLTKKEKWIIFLPTVLSLLINGITYALTPDAVYLRFLGDDHSFSLDLLSSADVFTLVLWAGLFLLLFPQLFLATFKLRQFISSIRRDEKDLPAAFAHLNIKWIAIFSVSLFVLILACSVQILAGTPNVYAAAGYNLFILLGGGLAGYYGMKQEALFQQVAALPAPIAANNPQDAEPHATEVVEPLEITLHPDEAETILSTMNAFMELEKPYLKTGFTIGDLSRETGIKRYKLTYVINTVMGKNFYAYVNEYRVKEAITLLTEKEKHYSIDGIAEMAGFNSRSSFYACFRKYTGKTPGEYLENV